MKSGYIFEGKDSYDTPAGTPVSRLFRLLGCSRWYFYAINFTVFIRTGLCAKRGELNEENQIYHSSFNIRLIEKCGGKIHIRGLDNLKALNREPVVLIGNHMSLLETAIFPAVISRHLDFTFIIKEALLRVPIFRHIMISMNAIPVGRTNPREDLKTVLAEGRKLLEKGRSIVVFDPEKFNTIGVKLAKSAKVKVVPFALKTDFLSNGKRFRDFGPVHPEKDVYLEFAPAMEVTGNGQEQHQQIIDFIQSRLEQWQKQEA